MLHAISPGYSTLHAKSENWKGRAGPMVERNKLAEARDAGVDRKDKRVARTEKAIRTAFFKLLADVDYEKISVSALSREAGVDRKTFYLHYKSIDALADELLRERARLMVRSLIDGLHARECDRLSEPLKIAELFSAFWGEFASDMPHLRSQMRHLPMEMVLDRLPDMLTEAFVEDGRLAGEMPSDMPKCYEQLCAAFVGAGMIALFRRWLLFDSEDATLEEAAALSEMLVFDGLHGVTKVPMP